MESQTLHLTNGREEIYLPLSDILFIENDGNYCDIVLTKPVKPYKRIRITLSEIMSRINALGTYADHHLFQISRKLIVNTSYIAYINPYGEDEIKPGQPVVPYIILNPNSKKLEVSKKGVKDLLALKKKEERDILLKTFGRNYMLPVPVAELNEEHPMHNGHEYVDLGLTSGTLWATCNIESNRIEKDGALLNREDRLTKESFEVCEYSALTQQEIDDYKVTEDIANNCWRGDWQMPTEADFQELLNECTWVWCRTKRKTYGALITGKNGNAIFLPAEYSMQIRGHYWTREYHRDFPTSAWIEENRDDGGVKVKLGSFAVFNEAFVRPVIHKSNNK